MGCSVSRDDSFTSENCDRMWKAMNTEFVDKDVMKKHEGWAVMRINLISTFKDFMNERTIIHDLINIDLAEMAKKRRIIIILEDFNSEGRASAEDPESVYLLAHCLDESRVEGGVVYIHLMGECSGYIVGDEFTDEEFLRRYDLEKGIALNEAAALIMQSYHASALFLHRDPSFLEEIPFHEVKFVEDDVGRARANYFVDQVGRIAKDRLLNYTVKTEGINNPHHKHIQFREMDRFRAIVKRYLIARMEKNFEYIGNFDSTDNSVNIVHSYFARRPFPMALQPEVEKVRTIAESNHVVLLLGDGGSGKTSLLYALAATTNSIIVSCSEFQSKEEMCQKILEESGRANSPQAFDFRVAVASYTGPRLFILIDDADEMTKFELQSLFIPTPNISWVVAVRRNVSKWLDKLNLNYTVYNMPSLGLDEAKRILSLYMDSHTAVSESLPTPQRYVKAAEKILNAKMDVEEGVEVFWSVAKCRVAASLVRSGASTERIGKLSKHAVTSLLETELILMETDPRGHLFIGTLCFLTLIPLGLREIELRYLLGTENRILPTSIKRRHRSLNFEMSMDTFGGKQMISSLRWRSVVTRLEHLLMHIDRVSAHIMLPSYARKTIAKRYFTTPDSVTHFQKRVSKLFSMSIPSLVDRSSLRDISGKKITDSYLTRPKSAAAKISVFENDAFKDDNKY